VSQDIGIADRPDFHWCRKPAWSSPPYSSKAAANRRSPAITGSPKAGYRGSSPATPSKATPPSNPAPDDPTPAPPDYPKPPSTSSSPCAPSSPAKASTPAPTPSPGTYNTTTASKCPSPPSADTSTPPASYNPAPTNSPHRPTSASPPNNAGERWQADFTHWWLKRGNHAEILCWIDDHSRYAISVTAHTRITTPIVVDEFTKATQHHGIPYSTLTDNGLVFTTRLAGGRGGRNRFEHELRRLNIHQINSTPNHPTTCGKVERFHQTLKRWLTHQPRATTLTELQTQLDTFIDEYNHRRPHRSLPHNATPATIYNSRPKADPATRIDTHNRVRTDRVDQAGSITLRHNGRLHHIGIGRIHHRTRVLILVQDSNITIINAATGEVLRELTLDPTRDYQPTGAPKGPTRKKPQT
jgi:transposase InsO family protein